MVRGFKVCNKPRYEEKRRGVFPGVADLDAAVMDYPQQRNVIPKPYAWTAKPDTILTEVAKAKKSGSRCTWPKSPCRQLVTVVEDMHP